MRLAAKLVLLFLVGVLLIVGLFAYLTIEQDRRLAIAEHERHASELAATLQPSIEEAVRNARIDELEQLFLRSTRQLQHTRVRLVEYSWRENHSRKPSVPVDMIVTEREVMTVSMPDAAGGERLYTYLPLPGRNANSGQGRIEISSLATGSNDRIRRSLLSSLIALLGVATLSGIVITIGGIKMVGAPLNQLLEKVHRVGRGDFGHPVDLHSRDELGKLGTALNQMCDQLALQRDRLEKEATSRIATVEQLRHAERLNMVGRMAAGIAHEIGTPLNVVSGRAELIASGKLDADANRESALAIQSEAQRITKTIRELLDFARQSTPQRSTQNLNELIESTATLMHPLVKKHDALLSVNLPEEPILADVDTAQMQQVLTNLIVNAAQATASNGKISVSLYPTVPREPGDAGGAFCQIDVRDNGIGISAEDREHLFEPFFTTKDVGQGTGLGLSISHGIVSEHGGHIELESELGQGSCFSIFLPVISHPPSTARESNARESNTRESNEELNDKEPSRES